MARTLRGLGALVPADLSQSQLIEITSTAVDRRLATDSWLWWLLADLARANEIQLTGPPGVAVHDGSPRREAPDGRGDRG